MKARLALIAGLLLTVVGSGCRADPTPEEVLTRLYSEARTGRMEGVLDTLTQESRAVLEVFWTLSDRYMYLPEGGLAAFGDVSVESSTVGEDVATLQVARNSERGSVVLRREEGQWKIDLLGSSAPGFEPRSREGTFGRPGMGELMNGGFFNEPLPQGDTQE